ncbi:MAG TPA: carboxylesterase family protein [Pseudonocardia sp.]|nr:carboxylesterase family protein [Pseudonocardia sp.]
MRRRVAAGLVVGVVVGVVAALGFTTVHTASAREDRPEVVRVEGGELRGVLAGAVREFSGIPYAAAPVGALRWRPPKSAPSWSGLRDATRPGAKCPQSDSFAASRVPTSEDCLYLNLTTPRRSGTDRAVLVWIHGGSFTVGDGDYYRARRLTSAGNLVVVTINYRLGALGFLAHPALGHDGGLGNFGLLDQQEALRWVRENIAAFGGDPHRVTIAGESAGAMSVCDHLASPASAGLFRAAIEESGPCQGQAPQSDAEQASIRWAAQRGCPDRPGVADCLRALPGARTSPAPTYPPKAASFAGPVYGNAVLPTAPVDAAARGAVARVPVLIGSNHDEGALLVGSLTTGTAGRILGPDAETTTVGQLLLTDALARRLPPVYGLGAAASSAVTAPITDSVIACPTQRMQRALSWRAPVYAYVFNDRRAPQLPRAGSAIPVGAAHAFELPYLFDIDGATDRLDAAQRRLSDQMINYWAQFVNTGNVDVDNQPAWPRYSEGARVLSLAPDKTRLIDNFSADHHCAVYDHLPR